jgi:sulfur-carrier protein
MSIPSEDVRSSETTVTVRYWAGARAAVGQAEEVFDVAGPTTLADVVRRVLAAHPDAARVVGVCSVLVGDRPVGAHDPEAVVVEPGSTVELLPPFAGG